MVAEQSVVPRITHGMITAETTIRMKLHTIALSDLEAIRHRLELHAVANLVPADAEEAERAFGRCSGRLNAQHTHGLTVENREI
jgi:hypothetical protein